MDLLTKNCVEYKDLADVGTQRLHSAAQRLTVAEQHLVQIRNMGYRIVDVTRGGRKKKGGQKTLRERPERNIHEIDAYIYCSLQI